MQAVQALFRVPEVAATMRELSKEMMRAGILEEMIEDTFEGMEDTEELEAEAEDEIQNVIILLSYIITYYLYVYANICRIYPMELVNSLTFCALT